MKRGSLYPVKYWTRSSTNRGRVPIAYRAWNSASLMLSGSTFYSSFMNDLKLFFSGTGSGLAPLPPDIALLRPTVSMRASSSLLSFYFLFILSINALEIIAKSTLKISKKMSVSTWSSFRISPSSSLLLPPASIDCVLKKLMKLKRLSWVILKSPSATFFFTSKQNTLKANTLMSYSLLLKKSNIFCA